MKRKVMEAQHTMLKDFEKMSVSKNGMMTVYSDSSKHTERMSKQEEEIELKLTEAVKSRLLTKQ